jgi:hypothetical protein
MRLLLTLIPTQQAATHVLGVELTQRGCNQVRQDNYQDRNLEGMTCSYPQTVET